MLIKLGFGVVIGEAVEVGEEIELCARFGFFLVFALFEQVIDQRFGMHFFLNIERGGIHHEVGPVLLVFAAPDQLRIEIAIAAGIRDLDRTAIIMLDNGFHFRRRNIRPPGIRMLDRGDCLFCLRTFLSHLFFDSFVSQCRNVFRQILFNGIGREHDIIDGPPGF